MDNPFKLRICMQTSNARVTLTAGFRQCPFVPAHKNAPGDFVLNYSLLFHSLVEYMGITRTVG